MTADNLKLLAMLLRQERDGLLAEWRRDIQQLPVTYHLDVPTLNDHIPDLLEELAFELEVCSDETMIEGLKENPITHGLDRLQLGFDIEEVVAEYNVLRGVIQNLVERHNLRLRGRMNHTINRVIDKSIGLAVKTYATQKALEVQQRREEHLSFVAHDLRSPLSAIAMAAKLLQVTLHEKAKDERTITLLETVHRNVDRLNALVVKVVQEEANLHTNLNEKVERREIKLRSLIEGLTSDLKPLAEASKTSLINNVPKELIVFADTNLLALAFQNLISNAINYTPNGEVTIGAREIKESGSIECWVNDNGAGIPVERLEKVFDKLETDPDKKSGLGLGLAIVKQFIEAHGGQVTVDSKLGQGSTFRCTIPRKAKVG